MSHISFVLKSNINIVTSVLILWNSSFSNSLIIRKLISQLHHPILVTWTSLKPNETLLVDSLNEFQTPVV